MENIFGDALNVVISFCGIDEVGNLSRTSKKLQKFCLPEKERMLIHYPMCVSMREVEQNIEENVWAQKWLSRKVINSNGKEDHRIRAYIVSIISDLVRVKHYRYLKERFPFREMDWKIGINVIINDLLTRTEEEEKELNNYFPV